MPNTLGTPAELALHALHAILPHRVNVPATPVCFNGISGIFSPEAATAIMEQYPKPVACQASDAGGILEIKLQHATADEVLGSDESLLIKDLLLRARSVRNARLLVVGRNGGAVMTDVPTFILFEQDYHLMGNHFVRSDLPTRVQEGDNIIRVLSYHPSKSKTQVRLSND
jgi:hypothetical protein